MNAAIKITRTATGLEEYIFLANIKLIRSFGGSAVIVRLGSKQNIEVNESVTTIQSAFSDQLIQVVEDGVTIFINRGALDRVVDDGNDASVFIFNDGSTVVSSRSFAGLVTEVQLAPPPYSGSGTPENVVTAPPGSLYVDTDGGANTTLYVKESGTGDTGWVAK